MENLILYLLSVTGMTHIVVYSHLLECPRDYLSKNKFIGKLLSCTMCSGVWCGWLLSPIFFDDFFVCCAAGFAGSFVSYFSDVYKEYLESLSLMGIEDES